jgi:hypothetical protein
MERTDYRCSSCGRPLIGINIKEGVMTGAELLERVGLKLARRQ